MQFDKYNIYSYNADVARANVIDEVDSVKQELLHITEYDDVKNFLTNKFGNFEGQKWINYPELEKQVYMYIDNYKVEFCSLKNEKQYWGRGWILEEVSE